jgi:hypothetical protein
MGDKPSLLYKVDTKEEETRACGIKNCIQVGEIRDSHYLSPFSDLNTITKKRTNIATVGTRRTSIPSFNVAPQSVLSAARLHMAHFASCSELNEIKATIELNR